MPPLWPMPVRTREANRIFRQQRLLIHQAHARLADVVGEERPGQQPREHKQEYGSPSEGILANRPKMIVKMIIVKPGCKTAQATPRTVCL